MPVSKGKVGKEPEGSSALEEAEEGGFGRLGEAACGQAAVVWPSLEAS